MARAATQLLLVSLDPEKASSRKGTRVGGFVSLHLVGDTFRAGAAFGAGAGGHRCVENAARIQDGRELAEVIGRAIAEHLTRDDRRFRTGRATAIGFQR